MFANLLHIRITDGGFFCCIFQQVESFALLVPANLTISANSRLRWHWYVLRRISIAVTMLRHVWSYPYEETLERQNIFPRQAIDWFSACRVEEFRKVQTGKQVTQ
ncbi:MULTISPECIES: hypothetical protein [Kosakonia]|uniref:hypothetical protein n=1 Tax=Kosakonia TaxID=1330547 RepID=UPI0005EF3BB3|nr:MULTISPECIES: hypothetical protein [Kosakonia]MCZ3381804.1 hypothetical protein [Kosakonia sp. SOY2]QHM94899.1 hypothetical protein FGE25_11740 [Kosakonia sacchari]